jgi:NAD(P)-dependent dehydrogenase (short-subunit alcohol dehydrogenase family)
MPHPEPSARSRLGGTVAISGGLGGLGSAIAADALARGAQVVLLGRREPGDVAAEVARLGTDERVRYRRHEATSAASNAEVLSDLDDLSGVVVNAGIYRGAPFLELSERDFTDTIDVNVTGSFLLAQAAARRMVELGRPGSIVLVSSWAQDVPDYGSTAYCVSKGGLRMLSRVMALELGKYGIRVNTFSPGIVAAGMAGRQIRTDAEYASRARRTVPLDRFQTAEEVAEGIGFLLSDESSYFTGSDLRADGGASLFRRDWLHAVEAD